MAAPSSPWRRALSTLLLVLVAAAATAILAPKLAAGEALGLSCGKGGNFSAASAYQRNLHDLAKVLPTKTSSSSMLFATAVAGVIPDRVYAFALCRGDVGALACADCVGAALDDAQQLCLFGHDASVYEEHCCLRYSNQRILDPTSAFDLTDFISRPGYRSAPAPATAVDASVALLLNSVANKTAISTRRFATGVAVMSFGSIYLIAECTPDFTAINCRNCLSNLIELMPATFSGKASGLMSQIRCSFRFNDFKFFAGDPTVVVSLPPPTGGEKGGSRTKKRLVIALPVIAAAILATALCFCILRKRKATGGQPSEPGTDMSIEALIIDIAIIRAATDNFNEANLLGKGGFGSVYKGILRDNQQIAVKRLSKNSGQGIKELKNELILFAKLSHRNVVKLIGVCLDAEKLLVYEYMPNKSLDKVLFDPGRCGELDWGKRFRIINGIARGLQYLHEESQVRVIHRDLKASNVLLDRDYNPKISDFGLARLFEIDQSHEHTKHVVGTYGYMSPEYVMDGRYSVKSDVFSFGVIILETVTRRRNGDSDEFVLLDFVWEHWTRGTALELIDSTLNNPPRDQMLKCIHIGLLCVQEDLEERPLMSSVNVMLSSNTVTLPTPSRPAFRIQSEIHRGPSHSASRQHISVNTVSITEMEPR